MLLKEEVMALNIETSTGFWINRKEFTPASYINLRSKLSTVDFNENEVPVAFFDYSLDGEDFVVIPKIKKELLFFIMNKRLMFSSLEEAPTVELTRPFKKPKFEPLPHQQPIIDKILERWNDNFNTDNRAVISLPPGAGKSFTSAYLVYKMQKKFIFVVYSAKLVKQTWENFCEFLGRDGMLILEKSKDFEDINWSKVKGLFLSHSMLRTLYKNYSFEYVMSVLTSKYGSEINIYDEFDREMGSLYRLQAFSNFKYNLYLTGTPFRSLHEDDKIMQLIFKPVLSLGGDAYNKPNKDLHIVHYRFDPTNKEWAKMQLMDQKLFKSYYNDFIARKDLLLDFIMSQFYKKDDSLIKKIIEEKGQIIVYAGRIENCQIVKQKLIDNFGIDEDSIGVYNSDISDKEKTESETKTWIISTCESLGRGYDNKNIRVLIYLEFSFSLSTWSQTSSRVARIGGNKGYIIYGLDHSFWKVEANWNKRVNNGYITEKFSNIYNYEIPDKWTEYYIHGYRKTSPMGIELLKEKEQKRKQMKWSKRI